MSEDNKAVVWNVVKAAFYLIAGVIWANIIFSFAILGTCVYSVGSGVTPVGSCRDYFPQVSDLLVGALAAAMAFGTNKRGETK